MLKLAQIVVRLVEDALRWLMLLARSTEAVRAENLLLCRQLTLFLERGVTSRAGWMRPPGGQPGRACELFDWRSALVVVQPATMVRWHRAGWRLFWRLKSRPGRPPIPEDWVVHYNGGRPHSALGPGVPDPPRSSARVPKIESRHRLAAGVSVLVKSVLGGLHHEYSIAAMPATA